LSPNLLPKPPIDLFVNAPLKYTLKADGYQFYSVGINRIDDGGTTYDDQPQGDDLKVAMPMSKPKVPTKPKQLFSDNGATGVAGAVAFLDQID
jgi:hypothetical protein